MGPIKITTISIVISQCRPRYRLRHIEGTCTHGPLYVSLAFVYHVLNFIHYLSQDSFTCAWLLAIPFTVILLIFQIQPKASYTATGDS